MASYKHSSLAACNTQHVQLAGDPNCDHLLSVQYHIWIHIISTKRPQIPQPIPVSCPFLSSPFVAKITPGHIKTFCSSCTPRNGLT